MHLNPRKPNILADMRAVANGTDLRDGTRIPSLVDPKKVTVLPSAKRRLFPPKSYPYASERQAKRQQRKSKP